MSGAVSSPDRPRRRSGNIRCFRLIFANARVLTIMTALAAEVPARKATMDSAGDWLSMPIASAL